jgi:hypothetical protein
MKRAKKLLLVLVVLVLISQIPFAYRRYKLGRLNAEIHIVNSSRKPLRSSPTFTEYKGVAHVHSFLGGHSTGTFNEIISAATANQLQFVIMTEHLEQEIDTAEMTLKGEHGGVLFVNGNEIQTATGERLLAVPSDWSLKDAAKGSLSELLKTVDSRGYVGIAAYPEEFNSWDANGLDGVEVFNVYSNARRINPVIAFFDVLWSQRSYPELLFATFYSRPTENLKKWDQALSRKRLTATAGNDAHANIGFSLKDPSGHTVLGLRLDPYETSFRLVRVHVFIPTGQALTRDNLVEAIKAGHCFIGFDLFGDTSGFVFTAENSTGVKIQGDEITLEGTKLKIEVPVEGRIVLFKDGSVHLDETGVSNKSYDVTERGVYRVEVYLPRLGQPVGEQPWIISNPIYVR